MRLNAFRSSLTAVAVTGGFSAFLALLGWAEYSNWRAQVSRVEMSLEQTAEAIVQHTDDVIEMSRLPLASLISEINDDIGHPDLPAKITALIAREMKASPTLDSLLPLSTTCPRPRRHALLVNDVHASRCRDGGDRTDTDVISAHCV